MVQAAETVEWIVAKNEVEAFFLEFNLIKRHKPRFNIRLKDDKSYPFLAVTLDEEWPRAMVLRGPEAQGRALLRALRARVRDPRDARPAAAHVPDPHVHEVEVRPAPPARPPVPLRAHREVRGAVRRRDRPRRVRRARRRAARLPRRRARRGHPPARAADARRVATQLEFERAARLRDQLIAVRKAIERQQMVAPRRRTSTSSASTRTRSKRRVQVFYVRKGRVVGRKGLVVDKVEDVDTPALVAPHPRAALRRRGRATTSRARSSCPSSPTTASSTRSSCRSTAARRCRVRVPQRGGKRELLQTATLNAQRGVRAPQAAARVRSQRARPRARRAAGGARPARSAAAHRVLRHLEPAGHRDRRLDGGDGRRPAEALRLPALQGARPRRARTTSRRWRRC